MFRTLRRTERRSPSGDSSVSVLKTDRFNPKHLFQGFICRVSFSLYSLDGKMQSWVCMSPWPNWNAETLGTVGQGACSLVLTRDPCPDTVGVTAWRVPVTADWGNLRMLPASYSCHFRNSVCGTG